MPSFPGRCRCRPWNGGHGPTSVSPNREEHAFVMGFINCFTMGAAIPGAELDGAERRLLFENFGAVTPENCMKPASLHPAEDRFDFARADALVEMARAGGLTVNGHTLLWHHQCPDWFFTSDGAPAGREQVLRRMRAHIDAVAGHFAGRVKSWDVVNEAIGDGRSWLNYWPSRRTNHPLLWDRALQPKPALAAVLDAVALETDTVEQHAASDGSEEGTMNMKHSGEKVVAYPAPRGAERSDQYTVTVNGHPVAVYAAPVWEPDYVRSFGGPYSFAYFDFAGSARVDIGSGKPMAGTRILPESCGVRPDIAGEKMSFTLTKPGLLSVEPDAKNGPLLLFANPLEIDPPRPDDPDVIYFGPGVHRAGEINVRDGQTLYIAGGAVVKGGVHARGDRIRNRGRGIIDGLDWEQFKGPTHNLIRLTKCNDVRVEGVILKDSWDWTFPMYACRNVHIDNVKIVSARCGYNDGIGVCNSQNVKIENCFIRTDDDCITTKGFGEALGIDPYPSVENLTVERCVLWTDRAHVWRLGCECRASVMRGLVFQDIDVVHYTDPTCPAITVQPAEGMLMEDVCFRNIRFNGEGQRRFIEIITEPTQWAKQQTPGMVRHVVFRDIVLGGASGHGLIEVAGSDPEHTVECVTFRNVVRYGRPLTPDAPHISIGGHTKDIVFRGDAGDGAD